jgi:hypothetical protein
MEMIFIDLSMELELEMQCNKILVRLSLLMPQRHSVPSMIVSAEIDNLSP